MKSSHVLLGLCLSLTASVRAAVAFVHPGARYAKYELDFVKGKIAQGAQPWTSKLNQAKTAGSDSRALGLALNWAYTGDVASADAAIAVLKSWNGHAAYEPPPTGQGNQNSLEGAWAATVLAPAAELLSQYPGWSDADKNATKQMFRTVFLPAMIKMSYWNGNVDLTQIDALLSIAVFIEDQAAFDAGIERLKGRLPAYFYESSDNPNVLNYGGSSKGAWGSYNPVLKWTDGLTQETCRDNGHHAQFAIAGALAALETAYIQGVDLYTPHQKRMVDAIELMALQLDTKDMQGTCPGAVTADRYNTLEIGYNHYHNRKGVPMEATRKELVKELRNGAQQFNMFHETLTHGDIVYNTASVQSRDLGSKAMQLAALGGNLVRISSDRTENVNVRVRSVDGTEIMKASVSVSAGVPQVLNPGLQAAPKGVYFVQAVSSSGSMVVKLIK
jgi:hypothetical protein